LDDFKTGSGAGAPDWGRENPEHEKHKRPWVEGGLADEDWEDTREQLLCDMSMRISISMSPRPVTEYEEAGFRKVKG
jgi:hypothetical protein